MGKTPHHTPGKFDQREYPETYMSYWRRHSRNPVREHTVYDLRYSAAELRDAEENGRRPQPRRVKRTASWWTYTRAWTPSLVRAYWANKNERANRRYVKSQLHVARRAKGDAALRLYEKAAKKPRRMLYDIW